MKSLSLLAASSCGDEMPRGADQTSTPTVGAVSDLPAVPVLDDPAISKAKNDEHCRDEMRGSTTERQALGGHDSLQPNLAAAGNSIKPNAGVKQAFPKGRWT